MSIPREIPALQNTALSNGNLPQMCLLPSNLNRQSLLKQHHHRNVNHHIPPTALYDYIPPFQSEWDLSNRMMPCGCYLHFGPYENRNNGNLHQVPPFSVSLNASFTSLESNASAPIFNGGSVTPATAKMQVSQVNPSLGERLRPTYLTQRTEYENLIQPYFATKQHHILTPSSSLSTPSLPSTPTSVVPLARTKRRYIRGVHQLPIEQPLSQYPNSSTEPRFSNRWSSLPLPSMADTLAKPTKCTFPVDLIRTSNFGPLLQADLSISSDSPSSIIIDSKAHSRTIQQHSLPHYMTNTLERHQAFGQRLPDRTCSHVQKTINHCSTNNLSYNTPYFLTAPHEPYYLFPPNPMSINIPGRTCSTLSPELNSTVSPISFANNIQNVEKERDGLRKSKATQDRTVEVQIDEKRMISTPLIPKIPIRKSRLQKKSKIEDHRIKTLIKRMKQKNKLAALRFMIRKRKQLQILKKPIPEVKIEKVVSQIVYSNVSNTTGMERKLPDIIASSLRITFNTAQKIESISLYYHRRHKPETETEHSLKTSDNTNNKLGLLIEAVNFIEMYPESSKLAPESIE